MAAVEDPAVEEDDLFHQAALGDVELEGLELARRHARQGLGQGMGLERLEVDRADLALNRKAGEAGQGGGGEARMKDEG